ncbi:hypothetical protein Agabi119p4_1042 [Agaricus bisporus var. burnettii]|uniref:Uncharacterized protein n=1 Tax=Agaricus bisporus var. burnettii TaxID=192524 RepID=A0A8H7FBP6_AGABI|nr:hypothetical protein Agabi119p4_1042 [Agaricus bisporus var. burnettii]
MYLNQQLKIFLRSYPCKEDLSPDRLLSQIQGIRPLYLPRSPCDSRINRIDIFFPRFVWYPAVPLAVPPQSDFIL